MTDLDHWMRRQNEMINQVGWMITAVEPTPADEADGTASRFAYTVGLTAHGQPKLILAGLQHQTAQVLLNDMARRVHDRGQRLAHGQVIHDLLLGYPAVIVEGPAIEALHPGTAFARYGRDAVALQQIVWPDPRGRFPWDPGYAYPPQVQPILAAPAP